jgi:hypothetical protein
MLNVKALKLGTALAAVVLSLAAMSPQAHAQTFVGSYAVFDGPNWPSNPAVYSGREAAALIFGGLPTDYLISIDPSMDPNTITMTAWYDGWGEHQGMIFNHDYKLDVGNPGYNDPGGLNTARSAYVRDGLSDTNTYRNYVWRADVAPLVPEPTTMALLGSGALGLVAKLRRRKTEGETVEA